MSSLANSTTLQPASTPLSAPIQSKIVAGSDSNMTLNTPSVSTSRPDQGRFVGPQLEFLKGYVGRYREHLAAVSASQPDNTGPRGIRGTKGEKSAWIIDNVFNAYCEKFDVRGADGPNVESLKG
ncbi:hypothetical protein H0H93_007565, partial [Arthromyces matolae]